MAKVKFNISITEEGKDMLLELAKLNDPVNENASNYIELLIRREFDKVKK